MQDSKNAVDEAPRETGHVHAFWFERDRGPFYLGALTVVIGAIALPQILSISLAIDIVILAIAATAFNLMLGYTGLLSFGQSAFFAIGGYAAGNAMLHLGLGAVPAIVLAAAGGAFGSALVGLLTLRLRNVYFILMTLAFAQLVYYISLSWREVTGGSSGLRGYDRPDLNLGLFTFPLDSTASVYALSVVILFICLAIFYRLITSPIGLVLRCIRDNQERVEAIGYPVGWYKLLCFSVAGAMTGVAGALYAIQWQIVPISTASMNQSAAIVFMSILGGVGHPLGPVLGAVIYTWLADVISVHWARWPLLFGVFIIAVVLFLRGGLTEGLIRIYSRVRQSLSNGS